MATLNWNKISPIIKNDINIIFDGYIISTLTDMEKRKIIFNYLVDNLEYDSELYSHVFNVVMNCGKFPRGMSIEFDEKNNIDGKRISLQKSSKREFRSIAEELGYTIMKHKGISNGISQYYKLLLEEVGVASYYVYTPINKIMAHNLNFVYDSETDNFSFDDITNAIIYNEKNKYFNFDTKKANQYGLGIYYINNVYHWRIPDESFINDYLLSHKPYSEVNNFLVLCHKSAEICLNTNAYSSNEIVEKLKGKDKKLTYAFTRPIVDDEEKEIEEEKDKTKSRRGR